MVLNYEGVKAYVERVVSKVKSTVEEYTVGQNFPNPFNPATQAGDYESERNSKLVPIGESGLEKLAA